MKLNNKVYDVLKWLTIIFLPALAKLIEDVFALWGIPYGAKIGSTIIYVEIFLGSIIAVSTISYNAKMKKIENDLSEDEDDLEEIEQDTEVN